MMNKRIKYSLLLLCCSAIVLAGTFKIVGMFSSTPRHHGKLANLYTNCEIIAKYIEIYYKQKTPEGLSIDSFVEFVTKKDARFSLEDSNKPQNVNVSLYFVSPNPFIKHTPGTIIAYTGKIQGGEHKGYRCAFVSRDSTVEVIRLSPSQSQSKISETQLKSSPDLFFLETGLLAR